MKRVVVHIDRLLLRGLNRVDRAALLAGLRDELGRLFAEPQVLAGWTMRGPAAHVAGGQVAAARVTVGAALPSHEIGVRLGRAVVGGGPR